MKATERMQKSMVTLRRKKKIEEEWQWRISRNRVMMWRWNY
jgi:hypothetical protein